MQEKKTAVALGLFDGVHLGHRAVLSEACAQRENGLVPAVYTFAPESAIYKPDSSAGYIYGTKVKMQLLTECGISRTEFSDFGTVRKLSGDEFAEKILYERLNAAFVCCGSDFRFGRDASCGVDELRRSGEKYGFRVRIVEDVRLGGDVVSSSCIRRLLMEGDIGKADSLLGRDYIISGTVSDGNHIGRTIDFPTINQDFSAGQLVPAYGVYSGRTSIDDTEYRTVTNIGVKPTVSGERAPLAETHILGFSGDLYGRDVQVSLERFIRPEKKFGSLDELKEQISRDISAASDI